MTRRLRALDVLPSVDRRWMDHAGCLGVRGFTELPVDRQLAHCNTCPVVSECLEFGTVIHPVSVDVDVVQMSIGGCYGGLAPWQLAWKVTTAGQERVES